MIGLVYDKLPGLTVKPGEEGMKSFAFSVDFFGEHVSEYMIAKHNNMKK